MKLTEIAIQLKETFPGFEVASGLHEEIKKFKETYGEAETIRIGEMDYIVINDVYKSIEDEDMAGGSISPLFYNSINNDFAIIDTKTSSTLIDEVYARVAYMQRICNVEEIPAVKDVENKLGAFIGDDVKGNINVILENEENLKKADIFQCHLIRDTGVSAVSTVYTFMLKNGVVKEIADNVLSEVKNLGDVRLLVDSDVLEDNKNAIQKAIFDKYMNSDVDTQSVNVKSIFEISMTFINVTLIYINDQGRTAAYNSLYLANNKLDSLNSNIHACNFCGHNLKSIDDSSRIYKLHVNMDVIDETQTTEDTYVFATGCEDCLVQCPECGGWHLNYEKFIGSPLYSKVKLAPNRHFIKTLRNLDGINFCSCRENIEWVYNNKSEIDGEYNVIPIEKMAFINGADEKISDYSEYKKYYDSQIKTQKNLDAMDLYSFAKKTLAKFKKILAKRFDVNPDDISITTIDKCYKCSRCGSEYYKSAREFEFDTDLEYRCGVCKIMDEENSTFVTRSDGMIFMRNRIGSKKVVNKYVVTKFGNLKKISSLVLDSDNELDEESRYSQNSEEEVEENSEEIELEEEPEEYEQDESEEEVDENFEEDKLEEETEEEGQTEIVK